jgi:MoaA/NifB/PqqE/SkfB family radical SAM enzyme
MANLHGLSFIHLELTSRCNKRCWMCGRRMIEKEYPELAQWGDMPWSLFKHIAKQIPPGITVQLHNNGEPTLYPRLGEAISYFKGRNITTFNTNGKLLVEKANEIIGNLDTLCVSVIQNDPEAQEQAEIVDKFLTLKGKERPFMIYRLLGKIEHQEYWESLPGIVANRILHAPEGSRNYEKPVTIPEIGICWDLLTHLAIDRYGNASICVRFDPHKLGVIGNLRNMSLEEVWNHKFRKTQIQAHLKGHRDWCPLCKTCDYWGVPNSW